MKDTNVYYVGGSKGGVGKSLFAFALVDYLLERGQNVLLVDMDTDNPDVYKAHVSLGLPNLQCRMNSLDDADGWADLLDTVQEYSDHAVVINAAARTKTSTTSYGEIMKSALEEMGESWWFSGSSTVTATLWNSCTRSCKPSLKQLSMCAATCTLAKRAASTSTTIPEQRAPSNSEE